jgi:hypothetical protein
MKSQISLIELTFRVPSAAILALSLLAHEPVQAAPVATPTPVPALSGDYAQVTRVVGEVGERVVTSREVRINFAIGVAMARVLAQPTGESAAPSAAKPATTNSPPTPEIVIPAVQDKGFPLEVGRVLDEWAVYLEAKSLTTNDVPRPELGRVVKDVQEFWEGKPAWQALEVSPQELRDFTERKLLAQAFLALKGDASGIPIAESDALQYYRRNRLRFGAVPFTAVKESIRTFLHKSQTEKRIEDWKDILRHKYKVRNFVAG